MTDGFNLGQFLQAARDQGVQDSEGAFTMAQDRALEKLAQFTLPGQFDWALKVVQAANLWNCPFLQVSQERLTTSFYFLPPQDALPDEEEIIGVLRSGALESTGAVHELCIALRSLVRQAKLAFVLAIRKDGKSHPPIYSGDDVLGLTEQTREQWASLDRDGLRLTVSHLQGQEKSLGRYLPTFSGTPRRHRGILNVLKERAFCSALPIYVNGKLLTNPFIHSKLGESRDCRPLALAYRSSPEQELSTRYFPALSPTGKLPPPLELSSRDCAWAMVRTHRWSTHRKLHFLKSQGAQSQLPLLIEQTLSQVHWVRQGVVCRRDTLPTQTEGTSVQFVVHVDQARTDLSGLQVFVGNSERLKLEHLQADLLAALPSISEKRDILISTKAALDPSVGRPYPTPPGLEELSTGNNLFTNHLYPESTLSSNWDWESVMAYIADEVSWPWRKTWLERWFHFVVDELVILKNDLSVF